MPLGHVFHEVNERERDGSLQEALTEPIASHLMGNIHITPRNPYLHASHQ